MAKTWDNDTHFAVVVVVLLLLEHSSKMPKAPTFQIGMKFGSIVPQVNMHWTDEVDNVTLLRW